MNGDLSILIYYASNRMIIIINSYIDDFFIISYRLIILNIWKEIFKQKYSIKDLREV